MQYSINQDDVYKNKRGVWKLSFTFTLMSLIMNKTDGLPLSMLLKSFNSLTLCLVLRQNRFFSSRKHIIFKSVTKSCFSRQLTSVCYHKSIIENMSYLFQAVKRLLGKTRMLMGHAELVCKLFISHVNCQMNPSL